MLFLWMFSVYLMSSLVSLNCLHCQSLGLASVFPCDRWLQMPGRWASMGRSQCLLHSWHAFIFRVCCPQLRVFVLKQLCFFYLISNEQKPYRNHRNSVWICFTWVHSCFCSFALGWFGHFIGASFSISNVPRGYCCALSEGCVPQRSLWKGLVPRRMVVGSVVCF